VAGFRLAPKAARARRRPWQRRRVVFGAGLLNANVTASDTVTITDVAVGGLAIQARTASDTVTVTDAAAHSGLGSSNTAQGGLVWLFAQGGSSPVTISRAAADTVTVTDTASGSLASVGSYSRSASDTVTITSSASSSLSIVAPGTYTMRDTSAPFNAVFTTTATFTTVDTTAPFNTSTTLPS
jgi:hypothetical protein